MANKYHARTVEVDGVRFASAAEGRHYRNLRLLEAAGEIKNLRLQPVYEIQEAFVDSHGHKWAPIRYRGDFEYVVVRTGRLVCCEVKGVRTRDWSMRERLFRYRLRDLVELVVVDADEV